VRSSRAGDGTHRGRAGVARVYMKPRYPLAGLGTCVRVRGTRPCWVNLVDRTAYAYKCGAGIAVIDIPTAKFAMFGSGGRSS
jgi:hypothetical protein